MFEAQQREVEAMMSQSPEFRSLFLKHREPALFSVVDGELDSSFAAFELGFHRISLAIVTDEFSGSRRKLCFALRSAMRA